MGNFFILKQQTKPVELFPAQFSLRKYSVEPVKLCCCRIETYKGNTVYDIKLRILYGSRPVVPFLEDVDEFIIAKDTGSIIMVARNDKHFKTIVFKLSENGKCIICKVGTIRIIDNISGHDNDIFFCMLHPQNNIIGYCIE